ncbi:hypothetical protein [Bacillus altitudinis]|uniref:hypothetical protein n=1 Tax=Bacillus altitudinis TaxID=293387 RepID=UPI00272CA2AB|nr:hypothetical protein [Bacillus altitudinis]WLF29199.1 hypothetical protein Q6357_12290 [Bacillus altitudinis]
MALLDESIKEIIGDEQYFSLFARMELQQAKDFRYITNDGKERKLTQKQALKRVNRQLNKHNQLPLSLSWCKKHWNKL